jgi:hypothetical protein
MVAGCRWQVIRSSHHLIPNPQFPIPSSQSLLLLLLLLHQIPLQRFPFAVGEEFFFRFGAIRAGDLYTDFHFTVGVAFEESTRGRNVCVIAAYRHTNVTFPRHEIVGGVEANPAKRGQIGFYPGVGDISRLGGYQPCGQMGSTVGRAASMQR